MEEIYIDDVLDHLVLSDVWIDFSDSLELIILKLNELVTLAHLILVFALAIIITLVIYNTLKKFFY